MELLATNAAHGLVALIWLISLRRLAGPVPPASWTRLLELGVTLPLLASALHIVDALAPPPWLALLRVDRWAEAAGHSGVSLWLPAWVLIGGTVLLFVAQELVPRLSDLRAASKAGQEGGERLSASLDRVKAAFAAVDGGLGGAARARARLARAEVRSIDSERRYAALLSGSTPAVVISRGLADALDDEALDAVVAHELAHLFVGGQLRLLWLWLSRLPQAASPATLLLFRSLVEAREIACDALAVRVTRRPLALAAALLEAHRLTSSGRAREGSWARAQRRVLRGAEVASVRGRVERLREEAARTPPPELHWATRALAVALLGGLLWLIG